MGGLVGVCPNVTELWHEVVVEMVVRAICVSSVCQSTV